MPKKCASDATFEGKILKPPLNGGGRNLIISAVMVTCNLQDFARGSDASSQLCVYVKGEKVVDLWGSHGPKGDPNYGPDSLQVTDLANRLHSILILLCPTADHFQLGEVCGGDLHGMPGGQRSPQVR